MLPKTFLSVSGTSKRTSGAAKGVRTPSSAHRFRTPNPVEKKKKANKAETTLNDSIEELTGQLSKNMNTIEEHSSQYNITDEILQSLANMSNPKVNHQDQEQIRNQEIVTSVVKSIVPIIVQVREGSQIDFVTRNVPWTFRGEGVLSWTFLLSQIDIDF